MNFSSGENLISTLNCKNISFSAQDTNITNFFHFLRGFCAFSPIFWCDFQHSFNLIAFLFRFFVHQTASIYLNLYCRRQITQQNMSKKHFFNRVLKILPLSVYLLWHIKSNQIFKMRLFLLHFLVHLHVGVFISPFLW